MSIPQTAALRPGLRARCEAQAIRTLVPRAKLAQILAVLVKHGTSAREQKTVGKSRNVLESSTLSSAFTCSQRRHVPPKRLDDCKESNATQVLVLPMLAPRSYTREDVVEVHCHGGSLCSARVLAAGGARRSARGRRRVHATCVPGRAHRPRAGGGGAGADTCTAPKSLA